MQTKIIFDFLENIRKNNNREWFNSHKDEYLSAKAVFEKCIEEAIARITEFDPSVKHLTIKDVTYRFYRDTRFHRISLRTRLILGHILQPMARRRFMEVITFILSRDTVCCHVAAIGFLPISLLPAETR